MPAMYKFCAPYSIYAIKKVQCIAQPFFKGLQPFFNGCKLNVVILKFSRAFNILLSLASK